MQTLATLVPLAGVGIALISIVCPLAVVVGIGGGGLFVPILILFMRFSTHEATVMSQSLIFGGTIAALLLNLKSRHPLMPNKPLIDVNLVLLMGPTQLIGIQIGAIINKLLPSFVLLAFLSLILAVSAFKLWKKGKMVMKKERLAASSSAEPSTNSAITRSPSQHSSLVISLEEKQVEREYSLKPIVDESADKTTACHEETHTLSEKIQTTSSPFPVHAISVPIDHLSQSTMPLRMDTTVVDSVKERCKNNVEKKKSSQFLHVGLAPSFSRSHIQGMQRMLTTESATPSSLSHIRGSAEEVTPRHKQKKWEFLKKMSSSHGSPEGMELPSETNLVDSTKIQWFIVILMWIWGLSFALLRGIRIPSFDLVTSCSVGYWSILAVFGCYLLFQSIAAIFYIHRLNERAARSGVPLQEGELVFTKQSLSLFCLQSGLAGLLAGIVGIGGGMILGPLLIGKDVPAQVVTAVNALLILLSSSSLAVLVVVKGDVSWSYALLLGSICLVTAFLGKYFIDAWIKRRNASYYLIFLLLGMIFVSFCTLAGTFIYNLVIGRAEPYGITFLCS